MISDFMRIFEFDDSNIIDVQSELRKVMEQSRHRKNALHEDIIQDKAFVQTFIDSTNESSISENQLTISEYYYPVDISINVEDKIFGILLAVQEAEYVGNEGSRLLFKYCGSTKTMAFPQDAFLSENEYRFVFADKKSLDWTISIIELKFKNNGWEVNAKGFDLSGVLQKITNI